MIRINEKEYLVYACQEKIYTRKQILKKSIHNEMKEYFKIKLHKWNIFKNILNLILCLLLKQVHGITIKYMCVLWISMCK